MNTTSSPRKDKIVYNTEEKKNEEPTEEVIESLIPQVGTFARFPRGVSALPDLSSDISVVPVTGSSESVPVIAVAAPLDDAPATSPVLAPKVLQALGVGTLARTRAFK
jgi:hypothetical protein